MRTPLTILYRGPLSSCNYACRYCPFAKHKESRAEHAADGRALERFLAWAESQADFELSVFFTPWGEALIRRRYQEALIWLTNLAHVRKAAIQTNITCKLDWVENCDKTKLALWITYHPTQISRERFLAKCADLQARGVRHSVGVVGLTEQADEIEALRAALPPETYLWINAFKGVRNYYTPEMRARFAAVDPLFEVNVRNYPSKGRACRTGEDVIGVDGDGNVQRCHFVRQKLGNLYDPDFSDILRPRPCNAALCTCHIGYIHMPELGLYDVFQGGILERIPATFDLTVRKA
jgi:MoaA/NifB/PqqE/SkfB family radical SAM enzyme